MGLRVLVFLRAILARKKKNQRRHSVPQCFPCPSSPGSCPVQHCGIPSTPWFSLCCWYSCGSPHRLSPSRAPSVPAAFCYKGQLLLLLRGSVSFLRSMCKTTSHFLSKQKVETRDPLQKTTVTSQTSIRQGQHTCACHAAFELLLPLELKQLCACPAFSCPFPTCKEVSDIQTEEHLSVLSVVIIGKEAFDKEESV